MTARHRGAGLRGLRPAPGDEALIDHDVIPDIDHVRWFRVLRIRRCSTAGMDLAGYLIGREDLGERWTSPPMTVYVPHPELLVVRRAPGAASGAVPAETPPARLPSLVEQLLEPPPPRPALPRGVAAALAHPDHRRYTAAGLPRRTPMGAPDPNCKTCYGSGQYRVGTRWKTCPCTKKKK